MTRDERISLNEAARRAGVSAATLTRWADEKIVPVRKGKWTDCPDFCYRDHPLIELDGLTLGGGGLRPDRSSHRRPRGGLRHVG